MSGMEPAVLAAIIGGGAAAGGAGINAAFSSNAEVQPFLDVDVDRLLKEVLRSSDSVFNQFADRAESDFSLPSATVQGLPTFSGGGLPFPIGAMGQDPALADPSLLTSVGSDPGSFISPGIGQPRRRSRSGGSGGDDREDTGGQAIPRPPATPPAPGPAPVPDLEFREGNGTIQGGGMTFGPPGGPFTTGTFPQPGENGGLPLPGTGDGPGILNASNNIGSGGFADLIRGRLEGGGTGGFSPSDLSQAESGMELLRGSLMPQPPRQRT